MARNWNPAFIEFALENKFIVPIPAHVQRLGRNRQALEINPVSSPYFAKLPCRTGRASQGTVIIKRSPEENHLLHLNPPPLCFFPDHPGAESFHFLDISGEFRTF